MCLCTRGANLFAKDCQGLTPVMVAIATGQKDILRIMLDLISDVLENASIVLWAIENDHVTLLEVRFHMILAVEYHNRICSRAETITHFL